MDLTTTLRAQIPNISQEDLDFFLNRWSRSVRLKRNEFLVKKGAIHPYLYFVQKGAIRSDLA